MTWRVGSSSEGEIRRVEKRSEEKRRPAQEAKKPFPVKVKGYRKVSTPAVGSQSWSCHPHTASAPRIAQQGGRGGAHQQDGDDLLEDQCHTVRAAEQ